MENRNITSLLQLILDIEALRALDVFQVYSSECRRDGPYYFYELIWISFINLNVEDIYIRKALEKDSLPFHCRLTGQGSPVSQSKDCCSVGDDSHQVSLGSIAV